MGYTIDKIFVINESAVRPYKGRGVRIKASLIGRIYTSQITPLNPPDILGGNRKSLSLPFIRGGLGRGKTLVNQLFQTCVYTVAHRRMALS
jgi:hypothetical protein